MSEAMTLAAGLKTQVAEIAQQNGGLANVASGSDGIAAAADVTGKYVLSTGVAAGIITATMQASGTNGTSTLVGGGTLILTPQMNGGSISWTCGGSIDVKYRPKSC
ncbi:pilin [Variovorax sp. ZS18.2.2]|nr:pilin [Variovorax sp. ZS18.2.2]